MTMSERDQFWQGRMEAFEASGLPGTQWCRTQDIPIKQFRYWRKKLRRLAAADTSGSGWTAVSNEKMTDAPLWIVCAIGATKIEIRQPFDPKLLQAVIQALPRS